MKIVKKTHSLIVPLTLADRVDIFCANLAKTKKISTPIGKKGPKKSKSQWVPMGDGVLLYSTVHCPAHSRAII